MSPSGNISPEEATYRALKRADRLRRRRDSVRSLLIVFLVIPGIVIGVALLAHYTDMI